MNQKKKHAGQSSRQQLLEIAERDLAKGQAKDVLGRAKNLFRQNPLDEERSLLERSYLARIQDLVDNGHVEGALVQFYDLMQLPPKVPSVVNTLPRLRVLLGIATETERAEAFQVDSGLLGELADRLVMRPATDAKGQSQLKAEAAKVTEALAAVERDDDAAAEELTKAIPRTSPFADWKLFVRGLSAYYQKECERANANWIRLDPARAANRIAQTLLAFSERVPHDSITGDVANRVRRLKNGLDVGALGSDLERLATSWRKNDGRGFFRLLRDLRQRSGTERIAMIQDVGTIAWKRFVVQGDKAQLSQLTGLLPGPAIDPHWYRVFALSEECDGNASCEAIEEKWLKYIQDINNIPAISAAHRPLVVALIEHRIALLYAQNARYEKADDDESTSDFFTTCYQKAVFYFRACAERWPSWRAPHADWANFCDEVGSAEETMAVYQNMLKHIPNDWDAHIWLAFHFIEADLPDSATSHIDAVLRLKPREKIVSTLRWNRQISKIRISIRQREFEIAHADVDRLEASQPKPDRPYVYDLLRSYIGYKSLDLETAEKHVAAAIAKVTDPLIIWISLACSCARLKFEKPIKKTIDDRLQQAFKNKPNSKAAGQLSEFLLENAGESRNYSGRAGHHQLVKKYLARFKNVNWDVNDLHAVCRVLTYCLRGSSVLMKTFASAGKKRFPKDPFFPAMLGLIEFKRGPQKCDLYAAEPNLKRALELNRNAEVPLQENELTLVRSALTTVANELENQRSFGLGFGGGFYMDDDEEEEDSNFAPNPSRNASKSTFSFGETKANGSARFSNAQEETVAQKLGLPPGVPLDFMLRMMPKGIRAQVEQYAKENGLNFNEALLRLLELETDLKF